jgi:hypothetical protein
MQASADSAENKSGCGCSGGSKVSRKMRKAPIPLRKPMGPMKGGYSLKNLWNNTKSGFSKIGSFFNRKKNVPGSTIMVASNQTPSVVTDKKTPRKSRRHTRKTRRTKHRHTRKTLTVKP